MNGETAQCGNPGKAFNGYIKPDRTKYQVGDQVDYECNSGFTKIQGNSQGTCLHNGTWDILPIPCGILKRQIINKIPFLKTPIFFYRCGLCLP